jgi:cell division protein FtsX
MSDVQFQLTIQNGRQAKHDHAPIVEVQDDGSWQARLAAVLRFTCRIAIILGLILIRPESYWAAAVALVAGLGAGWLEHGNPLFFLKR